MDETFKKRTKKYFRIVTQAGLSLLAPAICLSCEQKAYRQSALCFKCSRQLLQSRRTCMKIPVSRLTHGRHLASMQAFYRQSKAGISLIHAIKYQDYSLALEALLHTSASHSEFRKFLQSIDLVIPVPLHAARWRERGYNQASRIAKAVMPTLGIPINTISLKRSRQTKSQTQKDMDQRMVNMSQVFISRKQAEVKSRRVLLIDDVVTTGATLSSCAKALLEAGACEVHGLALLGMDAQFQKWGEKTLND